MKPKAKKMKSYPAKSYRTVAKIGEVMLAKPLSARKKPRYYI